MSAAIYEGGIVMAGNVRKLVTRDKKVAFMGCKGEGSVITYNRMKNFTSMSKSSNPNEYSRKYVDEDGEVTDVTGYSPSYGYAFDQYEGNPVHTEIIAITDGELVGDDAVRSIVVVDFTQPGKTEGTFKAIKRDFAVIPDSDGDDENTYTYSGNMKSKSSKTNIEVSTEDGWLTCKEVVETPGV